MVQHIQLRPQEVWAKSAYSSDGAYLGKVEAVGYRHGALLRVGVPARASQRRGLKFYGVDGARLDGDRLIIPAAH
jgi:hypothetical protein